MSEKRKTVLVTAGSRGIGAAIVKELVRNNYKVILTYHTNQALAETLSASLNQDNNCLCYPCDVTDANQVKSLCEKILNEHGTPYALINNAGVSKNNLFLQTSIEEWHDVINVNLNSIFYFSHCLINPMMLAGEGCIINISSISGLRGNAGQTSYSASKAAQIGFTRSLAKETGRFNIRVNCITPGIIDTDMTAAIPKPNMDAILKLTPLRKTGQPEDIAMMTAFLLGEGGRHITGQTLTIDGGLSA